MKFFKKLLLFLVVLVAVAGLLYYYNTFNFRDKVNEKFDVSKWLGFMNKNNVTQQEQQAIVLAVNALDGDWCTPQVITPLTSSSVGNQILGFDSLNNCCLRQFSGIDSCLNKQVVSKLCYDSNIGAESTVKYFTMNGYYITNLSAYNLYLNNLHESHNYQCVNLSYPQQLFGEA